MKVSIITTAHNEEKNIIPLCEKIKKAMGRIDYEFIAVDDGSTDKTPDELRKVKDRRFKIISLGKHRGKCFALFAGLKKSTGEIIATLDSDLQDDPRDIPRMVEELEKGYDCICGWRYRRRDDFVKRLSSKIGNLLNNIFLGLKLHDNTCPVKVFRRECVSKIRYFENFHRFIPVMTKVQGFRIKEYKVRHYPRIYGVSKYRIRDIIIGNVKTMFMVKLKHRGLLTCN